MHTISLEIAAFPALSQGRGIKGNPSNIFKLMDFNEEWTMSYINLVMKDADYLSNDYAMHVYGMHDTQKHHLTLLVICLTSLS